MYDRAIRTQVTRELRREQVATLLARYPSVTPEESRQILSFIRTGRSMDVGMLLRDDRLQNRLDAFVRQHRRQFRQRWSDVVAVIALTAALIATLLVI